MRLENLTLSPEQVQARETTDIEIRFVISVPLPAWSAIRIGMRGGRNVKTDWFWPQVEDPSGENFASLAREGQPTLDDVFIPMILEKGQGVTFRLMEPLEAHTRLIYQFQRTKVQSIADDRKKILIAVATSNSQPFEEVENCPHISILPRGFHHARLMFDSQIMGDRGFHGKILLEDEFNNVLDPRQFHSLFEKKPNLWVWGTTKDTGVLKRIGLLEQAVYDLEFDQGPVLGITVQIPTIHEMALEGQLVGYIVGSV